MEELEQLKKDNEELRAIIKDNVSISNIIAKQLRSWQRICIITNAFWFVLFIVITFCVFVYYYNTEEVIETETITVDNQQDGYLNNNTIKASNTTIKFYNSDKPLKDIYGETKEQSNNNQN